MKAPHSSLGALTFFATALALASAHGVEAGPNHDDLQTQINGVQATLQSQLERIPPAWSQTLPATQRFLLVLGGAAVLDKETGLVWEQSPEAGGRPWLNALGSCNSRTLGNRKGWRLPALQELASLIDPTQSGPALPAGHPFANVQLGPAGYWSATSDASNPSTAWGVAMNGGNIFHSQLKTDDGPFTWCVRGGHGGLEAQ